MAEARGKKLNLRLYLEGQRVPIQGITMSAAENSHIRATILIPPSPLCRNLKARTVVHVFAKERTSDPFHLLFEGEYIAYRNVEEPGAKHFEMHCAGFTNFWETVYQFFINQLSPAALGQQEVASFVSGGAAGVGPSLTAVNITLPKHFFGDYVVQALIRNGSDVQQAMLDAVHLMANMSGAQNGDVSNPRINSQIEKAFVNLRLGERVFVLPDDAIKSLISLKNAKAVLEQIAGTLSDFSTLSGIISAFLGFVYYDWVPIASPPFTDRGQVSMVNGSVGLDYVRPVQLGADTESAPRPTSSSILNEIGDARPTMSAAKVQRDVIFKPKTYFLPAPTCNLFFPSMYDRFSSGRNFLQEPTRMRVRTQPLPSLAEENVFNTFSYYAPEEILVPLQREQRTSPGQVYSTSKKAQALASDKPVVTNESVVNRHESLIVQEGVGTIDETITGVIPAFDELGFAEYSAIEVGLANTSAVLASYSDRKKEELEQENELDQEAVERAKRARLNGADLGGIPDDLHKYFAQVAQYKLDLARATQRAVEGISGPYNPHPVVGFPGMVFSNTGIYAGTVSSLNQVVNAQGQGFTSITLGYMREVSLLPGAIIGSLTELAILESSLRAYSVADPGGTSLEAFQRMVSDIAIESGIAISQKRIKVLTDGFDLVDHLPVQPSWLSEDYRPDTVADRVYGPLFGQRTPGQRVQSILEASGIEGTNQVLAANVLFLRYKLSDNRTTFVRELTGRSIATAAEVMGEFLGVGIPSPDTPARSDGMVREDLASGLVFGQTIQSSKANVEETIEDPYIPFQRKRVEPVRTYVNFLASSQSKGFRG